MPLVIVTRTERGVANITSFIYDVKLMQFFLNFKYDIHLYICILQSS